MGRYRTLLQDARSPASSYSNAKILFQLALSALNSSKSAYAFFVLSKTDFFWEYEFVPDDESSDSRFSCRFLIKVCLLIFNIPVKLWLSLSRLWRRYSRDECPTQGVEAGQWKDA